MNKRLVSALLCLIMLLTLLPTTALAKDYKSWEEAMENWESLVVGTDTTLIGGVVYTYGGDISSTGLNRGFENLMPNRAAVYKADNGKVLWNPTANPATLTFENATIEVPPSTTFSGINAVVTVPSCENGVNVIFKGTNSITTKNTFVPNVLRCEGETTITLSEDSDTTLKAKDLSTFPTGIYAASARSAHRLEITGSGKLTVNAENSGSGYKAIDSAIGRPLLLNGGTLAFSGEVYPGDGGGEVTLGGVTIPAGNTLDLKSADSVTKGTKGAVNNGLLVLKIGTDAAKIAALGLTGSGHVKVNGDLTGDPEVPNSYYKNDGNAIPGLSGTVDGLNFNTVDIKTEEEWDSNTSVEANGYTFKKANGSYTLTLGNLVIDVPNGNAIDLPDDGNVTIVLADGTSTRLIVNNGSAIFAENSSTPFNYTIEGKGMLELQSNSSSKATLQLPHNLTIAGGSIFIKNTDTTEDSVGINCGAEAGTTQNATVNITGGKLTITAGGRAIKAATGITLGRDMLITSPKGANVCDVRDNDGTVLFRSISEKDGVTPAKSVVIEPVPIVDSVSVAPASAKVEIGGTLQFNASVTGLNNPAQTVTWSVEGNVSSNTTISPSGSLAVAADETATMLTVKATSTVDSTKSGVTNVHVIIVTSVTVSPATASVEKGSSKAFTAAVTGENGPAQTVTWSVEGCSSANTGISTDGVLTVASNETASTLTVKATSTVGNIKNGTATVTVTTPPAPKPDPDPIPSGGDGGSSDYTPATVTVYNDPSQPKATVWLSGSGLTANDRLITKQNPQGAAFTVMRAVAGKNEVVATYDISLQSGKKSTGSAMSLTFDLGAKYTGQVFTLVHQKADGTLEYFYAVADSSGKLVFNGIYSLSPFMIVKGRLAQTAFTNLTDAPKTGDNAQSALWLGIALIAGAGLTASLTRRKRQNG